MHFLYKITSVIILYMLVLAASQRGCTINAIDCMYSKLPAEDE